MTLHETQLQQEWSDLSNPRTCQWPDFIFFLKYRVSTVGDLKIENQKKKLKTLGPRSILGDQKKSWLPFLRVGERISDLRRICP